MAKLPVERRLRCVFLAILASAPGAVCAVLPDAGKAIQSIENTRPEIPKPVTPEVDIEQPRPTVAPAGGIRIPVRRFDISGNTRFGNEDLQALIAEGIGKDITLAEIEILVGRITQYYRRNGYLLATAYLPPQDIHDGTIAVAVIEGRYGQITLRNDGVLSNPAVAMAEGEVVELGTLERNLLLLADTPGVETKATLRPGASVGTSDLVVDLSPGRLITGNASVDNFGNRFTGPNRLNANLNLNNALRLGEVFNLWAVTTNEDLNYVRLGYQQPVGVAGTKLGAAYTASNYRLGKEFTPLGAHGNAKIATLFVAHPLIRSRQSNLNLQLAFDSKRFEDDIDSQDLRTDKATKVVNVGLSGDNRDTLWGGGVSVGSLTLGLGQLDIQSDVAKEIDSVTARADGNYSKLAWSLLRLQSITEDTSLYLSYTGQYAWQNLDSSEKFILGGAFGVRAYPQGEGTGDIGQLFTVELRQSLPAGFQLIGFIDTGHVTVNAERWAEAFDRNSRSLSGWGLGLNWFHSSGFSIKATYAHKIGNAVAISDTDSTERFWLQAAMTF